MECSRNLHLRMPENIPSKSTGDVSDVVAMRCHHWWQRRVHHLSWCPLKVQTCGPQQKERRHLFEPWCGVCGVCGVFPRFHSVRRVLRSQSRVDTHGQRSQNREEGCCATIELPPNCATEARRIDGWVEPVMIYSLNHPSSIISQYLSSTSLFGSECIDPPGRWFRSSQKVLLTRFKVFWVQSVDHARDKLHHAPSKREELKNTRAKRVEVNVSKRA